MCENKNSLVGWCKEQGREDILKEWDIEKNRVELGLEIDEVSKGSGKKAWWVCKEGHSWEASICNRTKGRGCPYCTGKKVLKGFNDLSTTNPELVKDWDTEKNRELLGLEIDEVSKGSGKKAWWLCKEGHSYEQVINSKTKGLGCPYCAGQKVLKGFNDLATTNPELLKEWDKERNRESLGLEIDEVSKGSGKKAWWVCKEGHSYEQVICNKTMGLGCPYCSNKKVLKGYNDLATTNPELLEEWNYEKNKLKPEEVSKGIGKKVWWVCKEGHSWKASIDSRTNGRGCPYCSNKKVLKGFNDLSTTNPELVKDWDTEKNRELLGLEIEEVSKGIHKKVWWLCKEGHSYEQLINNKTKGIGCPYCSNKKVLKGYNDLATTNPELLEEWNYEKNKLKPEEVSAGSEKKVHWVCKTNKEHKWKALIYSRTGKNKTGCPHCSNSGTSFPEQYIYYVLKTKFKEVSNREIIEGYEYDIYIKDINLLIEYDGYYFHRVLNNGKKREIEKKEKANEKGYDFIRVKENNKVKEVEMKDNVIKYKNRSNVDDLNEIIVLIIDYINSKYSLDISKGIPEDAEQKAKELAAKEQYENSLEVKYPEIAKEWDYIKNGKLKPSQVSSGSNIKVYWLCKEGHSYEQVINSKTKGIGCPYCSGRYQIIGETDFATKNPELLKEWDYEKNKKQPYEYSAVSGEKVYWICKEGHKWEAVISSRVKGSGCPYCSNKKVLKGFNDLATTNTEILKYWDYSKNKIKPEEVSSGSKKKVWWKCLDNAEHSYQKKILQMVKSQSCPICRKEKRN